MRRPRVLGIVLAGGAGRRLWPLTAERAKPAVPFGGGYRLIDFVLSNLVNGGIHQIYVLTQYKSYSLDRHMATAWSLPTALGQHIIPIPAQQRLGPRWYAGSADAVFQSLHLIESAAPDYVAVFSADHVYRMDPVQMIDRHIASGRGVTVAALPVPRAQASAFGCIDVDASGRITRFLEKPADPPHVPGDPLTTLASMGIYVFSTSVLTDAVRRDAADPGSAHDMGGSVLPALAAAGQAQAYDFDDNMVAGATERDRGYWRDIGSLDSYYRAHIDLLAEDPVFNLHNEDWPIRTAAPILPPVKFVAGGQAEASVLGPGCVVAGGQVTRSVAGPGVLIGNGAIVQDSVLLPGARIGKGAVVAGAILDKHCVVPDGAQLGVEREADAARYQASPDGILVLGKGTVVR
jgi:glucose-1-phosphate adenylyltransferase